MRKRRYSFLTSIIVFLIIGVALFLVGFFIDKKNNEIIANGVKTQATITQIDKIYQGDGSYEYTVYVEYVADGQTYNNLLGSYYDGMVKGQLLDIWYLKTDPNQITNSTSNNYVTIITYSLGGIMILGSLFVIGKHLYKDSFKKLKNTGRKITAKITQVSCNNNLAVNGVHPWKISCEYGDETFKTPNIYDDLSRFNVGDSIDVYKAENGKKYYIDLDSVQANTTDNGRLL